MVVVVGVGRYPYPHPYLYSYLDPYPYPVVSRSWIAMIAIRPAGKRSSWQRRPGLVETVGLLAEDFESGHWHLPITSMSTKSRCLNRPAFGVARLLSAPGTELGRQFHSRHSQYPTESLIWMWM